MPYGTGILVNTSSGNGLLPDGTKIEFKFIHLIIHLNIPGANKLIECLWNSVAYRYRKSISIIELFVSIYIDIYRVLGN